MAEKVNLREVGVLCVRYFLALLAEYEAIRSGLDGEWGFPSGGTQSCLPAGNVLPKDIHGRIAVCVYAWMPDMLPVVARVRAAMQSGAVMEVSESEYVAFTSMWGRRDATGLP